MDDLTRIKGVGAATAKKLIDAGIVSFAALAALQPEDERLSAITQTPAQAAGWIGSATELAAAPPLEGQPPATGQDGNSTDTTTQGGTGGGSGDPLAPPATPKAKSAQAKPNDGYTVITVIGPSKGLRRAGHLFGATPSTIRVTPDELKLIEADPGLSVTPGDADKITETNGKPSTRLTVAECLDDKGKVREIRVLGPKSGRRRGGHAFGAEAVTLTPSKEQLEQILGDTELSVALA